MGEDMTVEEFAALPLDERAEVMARGRLIQTVDDLDGLPLADADRLRPIIEAQTPSAPSGVPTDGARITMNGKILEAVAARTPLPWEDAWRATIFDAVGDATRRFYQDVERKARDLPEPPDGYHWALVYETPDWGGADLAGNNLSYSIEGRFELVEIPADPAATLRKAILDE